MRVKLKSESFELTGLLAAIIKNEGGKYEIPREVLESINDNKVLGIDYDARKEMFVLSLFDVDDVELDEND